MQTIEEMFEELNGRNKPSLRFTISKARPTRGTGNPYKFGSGSPMSSDNQNPADIKVERDVKNVQPYVTATRRGDDHTTQSKPVGERSHMSVVQFALGNKLGLRHVYLGAIPSDYKLNKFYKEFGRLPTEEEMEADMLTAAPKYHDFRPTNLKEKALWTSGDGRTITYKDAMDDVYARPVRGNAYRNSSFMNMASGKEKDRWRDLQISDSREADIDYMTRQAIEAHRRMYGPMEISGLSDDDLYAMERAKIEELYDADALASKQAASDASRKRSEEWNNVGRELDASGQFAKEIEKYERDLEAYNAMANENAEAYAAGLDAPNDFPRFQRLHHDYVDRDTGETRRSYGALRSKLINDILYDRNFESKYGDKMDPALREQGAYKGIRPIYYHRGQPVYADEHRELLSPLGFTDSNFLNRNINDDYFDDIARQKHVQDMEYRAREREAMAEREANNAIWTKYRGRAIDEAEDEAMARGIRARDGVPMIGDEDGPMYNFPWDRDAGETRPFDDYNKISSSYARALGGDTADSNVRNLMKKVIKGAGMGRDDILGFSKLPATQKIALFRQHDPTFAGLLDRLIKAGVYDEDRFSDENMDIRDMLSAGEDIEGKLGSDQRLWSGFDYDRKLAAEGPGQNSAMQRLLSRIKDENLTTMDKVQALYDRVSAPLTPEEQDRLDYTMEALFDNNIAALGKEEKVRLRKERGKQIPFVPTPAWKRLLFRIHDEGLTTMDKVQDLYDKVSASVSPEDKDFLDGFLRELFHNNTIKRYKRDARLKRMLGGDEESAIENGTYMDNFRHSNIVDREHKLIKYAGEYAKRAFTEADMPEAMADQMVRMLWDYSEDPESASPVELFQRVFNEIGANENSRIRAPLQTAAKYISRAREGARGIPTLPYNEYTESAPKLDLDAMKKYPSLRWLEDNGVSKAYGSKLMEEYMGGDWTGRNVSDKDFDYIMPSNVARREMDSIMAQQKKDEENKAKGLPTDAERKEADEKAKADAQKNAENLKVQAEQNKTNEDISAGMQQMESWNVNPPKEIETPKRETGSGAKVPDVNDPKTPEAIASQTKPAKKSVNDMAEESFQMESLRDMMCGIMKKGDKAGHPYGRPMEGNVFAYGSTISKMGEDKGPVMPKEISEASTEDEGISRKKLDIKKI